MIGLETAELEWVRLLVGLLRHPDPLVGELACEGLLYARAAARETPASEVVTAQRRDRLPG